MNFSAPVLNVASVSVHTAPSGELRALLGNILIHQSIGVVIQSQVAPIDPWCSVCMCVGGAYSLFLYKKEDVVEDGGSRLEITSNSSFPKS